MNSTYLGNLPQNTLDMIERFEQSNNADAVEKALLYSRIEMLEKQVKLLCDLAELNVKVKVL